MKTKIKAVGRIKIANRRIRGQRMCFADFTGLESHLKEVSGRLKENNLVRGIERRRNIHHTWAVVIALDLRDQYRLDLQVTSLPAAPPTLVPPFPGKENNHRKRFKKFWFSLPFVECSRLHSFFHKLETILWRFPSWRTNFHELWRLSSSCIQLAIALVWEYSTNRCSEFRGSRRERMCRCPTLEDSELPATSVRYRKTRVHFSSSSKPS